MLLLEVVVYLIICWESDDYRLAQIVELASITEQNSACNNPWDQYSVKSGQKKIFMTMLCPSRETTLFISRYCVCVV